MVERAGNVPHGVDERRLDKGWIERSEREGVRRAGRLVAGEDEELGEIVGRVLDILGQDAQAIVFGGASSGDRRVATQALVTDAPRAPRRVAADDRPIAMPLPEGARLRDGLGVRQHGGDRGEVFARQREEAVVDRQIVLGADRQRLVVLHQQIVGLVEPAAERVLDRDHPEVGLPRDDRREDRRKIRTGHRRGVPEDVQRRFLGVGPMLAEVRDSRAQRLLHPHPSPFSTVQPIGGTVARAGTSV